MQNGDISNETSPRIAVSIDLVTDSELEASRKLLKTTTTRKATQLKRMELAYLWNISTKYNLSIELFALESEGWTQEALDAFIERLDRRGTNPFNYGELYYDTQSFVDDMPYRANLKGVIDLPERTARYGSWGMQVGSI